MHQQQTDRWKGGKLLVDTGMIRGMMPRSRDDVVRQFQCISDLIVTATVKAWRRRLTVWKTVQLAKGGWQHWRIQMAWGQPN